MPSEKPYAALAIRSTIQRKIISIVLIGITTTILLVTLANSWRETARYSEVKTAEITGIAQVFASAVADAVAANDRTAIMKPLRAIGRIPSFSYARVDDLSGKILADLGATVILEESAQLPVFMRSSLEVRVAVFKGGIEVGQLTVLVKTDDLRASLMEGLLTGLLAALLSGGMGVAIATRLQKRITDPLRKLTETMFEVERTQNFEQSVDHNSNDETGVLVNTFNNMLGQIRARDDRLVQHRDELEHKVEERTHDLKIAKDTAEDANAAKSEFLATMSHEIRTPMNGMLVMAELLASANLTDKHRRYADVVVKSGQSLLTIINDILDFSKIESGKMELECIDLDPSTVVDDVLNLFWDKASSKGLDLAGYVAPNVPKFIRGDPVRLNQILSNLVNNALKFTEQGYVKVSVEWTGVPREPLLKFTVSDTGIGIPPDKLATVFESFSQADQSTTRRFGGTGLGLAICKRLVSAMDGEISVTSDDGAGSEFFFTVGNTGDGSAFGRSTHKTCNSISRAVVAVNGQATRQSIATYLTDRGIEVESLVPDAATSQCLQGASLVLAEPDLIARFAGIEKQQNGRPYMISTSQLGDVRSDDLIASGDAQDVLMRPVSRNAFHELVDRLDQDAPMGRALLKRNESTKPPAYPRADVLVADDSAVNREVITEALKQMQVAADVVEDGMAAVQAATEKIYHLIFMDCSMPDMDGFEATRRIRAAEKDTSQRVPIVALSAHVAGAGADEWREAGMDLYLSKPFRINDLIETFEEFLPEEMRQAEANASSNHAPKVSEEDELERDVGVLPIIDATALRESIGCEPDERSELLLRVLSLFEQHGPPALLKIAESARDHISSEIGDAAHALKSMCLNIGAVRLAAACDRLENDAKNNHLENLNVQLLHLQKELVLALDEIKKLKGTGQEKMEKVILNV